MLYTVYFQQYSKYFTFGPDKIYRNLLVRVHSDEFNLCLLYKMHIDVD